MKEDASKEHQLRKEREWMEAIGSMDESGWNALMAKLEEDFKDSLSNAIGKNMHGEQRTWWAGHAQALETQIEELRSYRSGKSLDGIAPKFKTKDGELII